MAIANIRLLAVVAIALGTAYVYQHIALYLRRRSFKKEHGCLPVKSKYEYKDPFLGLDLILGNIRAAKEHRFLEASYDRFQKYGTTFRSGALRTKAIVTIEPQNVKTVLSTRFKDYSLGKREGFFGALLGKGIFTTDGEAWQHSRHMIRPNFAREQVADLDIFEHHVQEMFKQIPRDGATVDLQDIFFRLTIDSATEFLFGESVDSQRGFLQEKLNGQVNSDTGFAEAFNYAQHGCAYLTRLGALKMFYRDKKFDEANKICHEYVGRYVDKALAYRRQVDLEKAPAEEKYVFLHQLAKETNDPIRLRDELLNVLLAGRDTTASLLSNMFFVLAQRPDIWSKLRAEVAQLNGALPSYEQLRNLKYVKYCMNESLRLHPVVPVNSRAAITDTVLPVGGGPDGLSPVFVAKGSPVVYTPYSMHRRFDYYGPDALEFRPERWETLRPGWEYLPFNGGPRICLGQQYALTEAGYVTTRLAQMFERLESRDADGIWREGLSLTLASHGGCKVALWEEA